MHHTGSIMVNDREYSQQWLVMIRIHDNQAETVKIWRRAHYLVARFATAQRSEDRTPGATHHWWWWRRRWRWRHHGWWRARWWPPPCSMCQWKRLLCYETGEMCPKDAHCSSKDRKRHGCNPPLLRGRPKKKEAWSQIGCCKLQEQQCWTNVGPGILWLWPDLNPALVWRVAREILLFPNVLGIAVSTFNYTSLSTEILYSCISRVHMAWGSPQKRVVSWALHRGDYCNLTFRVKQCWLSYDSDATVNEKNNVMFDKWT